MNIQEIELLLTSFNKQAGKVKDQLKKILVAVSDGRVPSVADMSAVDTEVVELRSTYDGIYEATKDVLGKKIPEKGESINNYVSAVNLKKKIIRATDILTRFLKVKSELDSYTRALKPFQEAASGMLKQINEETIGDILPKTEWPDIFLKAMKIPNLLASEEGLSIMRKIKQHYPFEVLCGIAAKKFTIDTGENREENTKMDGLCVPTAQMPEESSVAQEAQVALKEEAGHTETVDIATATLREKLPEDGKSSQPVCETTENSEKYATHDDESTEESQNKVHEDGEAPELDHSERDIRKTETERHKAEQKTSVSAKNPKEKAMAEDVAATPESLLKKRTCPTDDEFCSVVRRLLNPPDTADSLDGELLKSSVVNAALLAHGAGLLKEYKKSKSLSLQLCLATHLLIKETDYTSEKLANAFQDVNDDNSVFALTAYMLAMLTPAKPFDFDLSQKTDALFKDYGQCFSGLESFKPLLNIIIQVKKHSSMGFSPLYVSLLGSDDERKKYVSGLAKRAEQFLTVPKPNTGMKALPTLYNDCFGKGSDLYVYMSNVSKNNQQYLELAKLCLEDYYYDKATKRFSDDKISSKLQDIWKKKNKMELKYSAHKQAVNQFRIRLEVLREWVEYIECNSDQNELQRLRTLKDKIIAEIQRIQQDDSWKKKKNATVLAWVLYYINEYLSGKFSQISVYSDLLFTGVISLDDDGFPVMDDKMTDVEYYEPWRNALLHITTPKRSAEAIKAEILGDIPNENDEENGLKDNLHQLLMLGKFLSSNDNDYKITDKQRKEAEVYADCRTREFEEKLELAYAYNRINEMEKETLCGQMNDYKNSFYELGDFAAWRLFLKALEKQIHEDASRRKKELRKRLDDKLESKPCSTLLKEAVRLLEKDQNFAVAEEYITRFESGETELEDVDSILHDKNYFEEFLNPDKFKKLMNACRNGKGKSLSNFGLKYVEENFPEGWTERNKKNSGIMIKNWPFGKRVDIKADHVKTLFKCLGFDVVKADKKQKEGAEIYQINVRQTKKSMADYRHPIAAFGTQIKGKIDIVMLSGNNTPQQLVDNVTKLNLGGISIVLADQPIDAVDRQTIGEKFHNTSLQNRFLLIDQALFLYLALHQETERLPALLRCTLPYTIYQPFVRDGGPTADEMFCGRTQELATIIDPNGACVVYGGRQLGKTALLQRAESRCSKPEDKEYAVYSTIAHEKNEQGVVKKLTDDIKKKTNIKIRFDHCKTLRKMCDLISEQFRKGQIESMHLLIDEVDDFLASIADEGYKAIQPLVDLKSETKNKFKFVLTGLHNVCRAKNATTKNGIFGQLGTPLCIQPLSHTDALKLLSRPLSYLGFQIERDSHLETILTNTNYYPGILQFFGYKLVEATLIGDNYRKFYNATKNPPFGLNDEQLGAVMKDKDLNNSIKDKFRLSLELDPRYFMIARCITMLYHLYKEERKSGGWVGFLIEEIQEIVKEYQIHCLENESIESLSILMDEMVDMGILSKPNHDEGGYRLRRSSFVDIIGADMNVLESDIININNRSEERV